MGTKDNDSDSGIDVGEVDIPIVQISKLAYRAVAPSRRSSASGYEVVVGLTFFVYMLFVANSVWVLYIVKRRSEGQEAIVFVIGALVLSLVFGILRSIHKSLGVAFLIAAAMPVLSAWVFRSFL